MLVCVWWLSCACAMWFGAQDVPMAAADEADSGKDDGGDPNAPELTLEEKMAIAQEKIARKKRERAAAEKVWRPVVVATSSLRC